MNPSRDCAWVGVARTQSVAAMPAHADRRCGRRDDSTERFMIWTPHETWWSTQTRHTACAWAQNNTSICARIQPTRVVGWPMLGRAASCGARAGQHNGDFGCRTALRRRESGSARVSTREGETSYDHPSACSRFGQKTQRPHADRPACHSGVPGGEHIAGIMSCSQIPPRCSRTEQIKVYQNRVPGARTIHLDFIP